MYEGKISTYIENFVFWKAQKYYGNIFSFLSQVGICCCFRLSMSADYDFPLALSGPWSFHLQTGSGIVSSFGILEYFTGNINFKAFRSCVGWLSLFVAVGCCCHVPAQKWKNKKLNNLTVKIEMSLMNKTPLNLPIMSLYFPFISFCLHILWQGYERVKKSGGSRKDLQSTKDQLHPYIK